MSTYTNTQTLLLPQGIMPSISPAATAWFKAVCHFHHERSKPLTFRSSTPAPFSRCIHFSEPSMNISGVSDRSSEEWKERRSRWEWEVQGGMGNHIWFCRSHKWLKLCRFQSDYLSLHQLHRFPSVIALSVFPSSFLSVWYLSLWWNEKKENFDGGCAQLYWVAVGVCG